jgi:hypothetical protein
VISIVVRNNSNAKHASSDDAKQLAPQYRLAGAMSCAAETALWRQFVAVGDDAAALGTPRIKNTNSAFQNEKHA